MSDCEAASPAGAGLKSLEEALELILSHPQPVAEVETVTLGDALGRVLASGVVSQVTVPPWDNSAMDGYAVRCADLDAMKETTLPVSQRIPAGSSPQPLQPGSAARIFTGAPIPQGADAVVMQELCRAEGERVVITEAPKPGTNIRLAGEDTRRGDVVIPHGVRLEPQHIGLAAAVGVAELQVYRPLRVAIFSTGDELVYPGTPLAPGKIYNSNEFTLAGLLTALGCEVTSLGIVEDDFQVTCDALKRAAEGHDLVMTSGGVSVGEEDHLKPAIESLGTLDLWKIAIRPGKPLAFGYIGKTPFIGTPGNPVSLFVTFALFARPFIQKSQGIDGANIAVTPITARALFDWPRPDKRREFARARLTLDARGDAVVELFHSRSSGVLSSLVWANGLAILPENQPLEQGDSIQFLPYNEILK